MEDLLISILETFDVPICRQGSLGDDPYPPKFFTFWNNTTNDGSHYDNQAVSIIGNYDVNYYSIDPADTYKTLRDAIVLLKEAGFIVSGDGYDVISDEVTHSGRGTNAIYMNYEKESD